MTEWTWAGAHVAGLDGIGVYFAAAPDRAHVEEGLRAAGYTVRVADGSAMTDAAAARTEVARALQLEPTAAANADALADSLSDVRAPAGTPSRVALVWTDADVLLTADLPAWTELVSILTATTTELWDPENDASPDNVVFETVALVTGFGVRPLS